MADTPSFKAFLAEENSSGALLNEIKLARVWQHDQDRNIGTISASRSVLHHEVDGTPIPGGRPMTDEENHSRNLQLAKDLSDHGLSYVHTKGRYIENFGKENATPVDEHSFYVIGKKGNDDGHLKGVLQKLGSKYDQDSILHKPHDTGVASLIGTNHTSDFPGHGNEHALGTWHPNRITEFHTILRNATRTKKAVRFDYGAKDAPQMKDDAPMKEGQEVLVPPDIIAKAERIASLFEETGKWEYLVIERSTPTFHNRNYRYTVLAGEHPTSLPYDKGTK